MIQVIFEILLESNMRTRNTIGVIKEFSRQSSRCGNGVQSDPSSCERRQGRSTALAWQLPHPSELLVTSIITQACLTLTRDLRLIVQTRCFRSTAETKDVTHVMTEEVETKNPHYI